MDKAQVLASLSPADKLALTEALTTWRKAGDDNPRIPLDYDVDGDGILDAWALDGDELTLVSVSSIEDTVYVSTGGGVEAPPEVLE